ncbi:MAG: hypothetical protein ACPGVM_07640, partial [Prochlorococcaceae cyanobacterium]
RHHRLDPRLGRFSSGDALKADFNHPRTMAGERKLAQITAATGLINAEKLETAAIAGKVKPDPLMKVHDIPRSENRKALAPLNY